MASRAACLALAHAGARDSRPRTTTSSPSSTMSVASSFSEQPSDQLPSYRLLDPHGGLSDASSSRVRRPLGPAGAIPQNSLLLIDESSGALLGVVGEQGTAELRMEGGGARAGGEPAAPTDGPQTDFSAQAGLYGFPVEKEVMAGGLGSRPTTPPDDSTSSTSDRPLEDAIPLLRFSQDCPSLSAAFPRPTLPHHWPSPRASRTMPSTSRSARSSFLPTRASSPPP